MGIFDCDGYYEMVGAGCKICCVISGKSLTYENYILQSWLLVASVGHHRYCSWEREPLGRDKVYWIMKLSLFWITYFLSRIDVDGVGITTANETIRLYNEDILVWTSRYLRYIGISIWTDMAACKVVDCSFVSSWRRYIHARTLEYAFAGHIRMTNTITIHALIMWLTAMNNGWTAGRTNKAVFRSHPEWWHFKC